MAQGIDIREIEKTFGVSRGVARAINRYLRLADLGHAQPDEALERVNRITNKGSVERLRMVRYDHRGNELETEEIGHYLDVGDTYDTTLVWVDRKSYEVWDPKQQKHVWNDEGFILSSFGDVLQAWEDWKFQNDGPEDIEAMGPNPNDGCDIWTDDARYFFVYHNGLHGHDNRNLGHMDKDAGEIPVPTPPDAAQNRIDTLEKMLSDDEAWDDYANAPVRDAALVLRVEAEIEALKNERDGYDDPWDGSSDAFKECDRLGVWWYIHKFQTALGCSGNVWFRYGSGRRYFEWKLVSPPDNYLYWQRAQEWRKAHRGAPPAAAVQAQVAAIGAAPAPGDLWTDHLYGRAAWGVTISQVGSAMPLLHITPAQVKAQQAWPLIWRAVQAQSARLGRPARLWSAQPMSSPLTWALVTPDRAKPLSGGPRGLGGLGARRRRSRR